MKVTDTAIVCALTLALSLGADAASWSYKSTIDKMTSQTLQLAAIASDNSLKSAPPYVGPNRVRLIVRQYPRRGFSVMLQIDRGQIVCNDCNIRVRFDENEPELFSTSPPSDYDPQVVFLVDGDRFVERARWAKHIKVEFVAYRQGVNIGDFRVRKSLEIASNANVLPVMPSGPIVGIHPSLPEREKRLTELENYCRLQKEEFIECLVILRACYDKVETIAAEIACKESIESFPGRGLPK